MTRKKREWYQEAKLHVIARGNHRSDIFKDKTDYELYLNYLQEANEYYDYKYHIVAYTLMTNHIHLIIETEDKDISDFIKRVHSRYAWNFNKKYNYIGHLFQDRYRSELIDTDKYLLESSRYIHLNPVKAKMVELPEDYEWSSYNQYIIITKDRIVECDKILSYFKKDNCRELYKKFVESSIISHTL
ncbi:transposase [Clostridium gasigenes]|nr:transposase [Clostridium gasigenes]